MTTIPRQGSREGGDRATGSSLGTSDGLFWSPHTLNSKIDLVSATVTTDLQVSSLLFQLKVAADSERRSRVKSEQAGGRRGERPAETRRE